MPLNTPDDRVKTNMPKRRKAGGTEIYAPRPNARTAGSAPVSGSEDTVPMNIRPKSQPTVKGVKRTPDKKIMGIWND